MIGKSGAAARPNGVIMLVGTGPYVLCPTCHKQIHFVKTTAGKNMPCELNLKPGDSRVTLVTHDGRTVRRAGPSVTGYEPHWGYCERGSTRPDGLKKLTVKGGNR
jgi:hypothetical protein